MAQTKEQASLTLQQVQLGWIKQISELIGQKISSGEKHALIEWHLAYLEATVPPPIREANPLKEMKGIKELDDGDVLEAKNNHRFHKIMEWISVQNQWYSKSQVGGDYHKRST